MTRQLSDKNTDLSDLLTQITFDAPSSPLRNRGGEVEDTTKPSYIGENINMVQIAGHVGQVEDAGSRVKQVGGENSYKTQDVARRDNLSVSTNDLQESEYVVE